MKNELFHRQIYLSCEYCAGGANALAQTSHKARKRGREQMTVQRVYLNNDWGFTEKYSEELLQPNYDESVLENVRLPHTCKETPFHYFDEHIYQMVSVYRKVLTVP